MFGVPVPVNEYVVLFRVRLLLREPVPLGLKRTVSVQVPLAGTLVQFVAVEKSEAFGPLSAGTKNVPRVPPTFCKVKVMSGVATEPTTAELKAWVAAGEPVISKLAAGVTPTAACRNW